jgi:hypothetical protein
MRCHLEHTIKGELLLDQIKEILMELSAVVLHF